MSFVDFTSCRVSDIRAALIKAGMTAAEVSMLKGKTELVNRAVTLGLKVTDIDVAKEENVKTYEFDAENDDIPMIGTEKWHSYVMSKFTPDELEDGAPKVDGLRRVAMELIGETMESGPVQIFPSTDPIGPGRATVVFQITFLTHEGHQKIFREVADSCAGNTDPTYVKFPVAIASTRAEARCLRKALMLRGVSADEVSKSTVCDDITKHSITKMVENETGADLEEFELINENQVKVIKTLCGRLEISVEKFMNSGKGKYNTLEEVSKSTAIKMIKKLSDYQNNVEEIPVAIKKGVE